MKILFFSTWFPCPPDNGSKIRVYHLLHALGQKHEITLLSFAFDTAQPNLVNHTQEWLDNVQIVSLNPFTVNQTSAIQTFFSSRPVATRPIPAMSQHTAALWQATPFDAVIASTNMMAAYALQSPPHTARILEEHNSLTRWMYERYTQANGLINRLRYWVSWQKARYYEACLFRQFDQVIMVSPQDQITSAQTLPAYDGPVSMIPNGVNCQHNRPGLVSVHPNHLVFNGALTYSANFTAMAYFLVQIYPLIKAQIPDVSLTITGATDGVAIQELALDESVQLTGWVKDVRQPVAEAMVCVAPILEGGGTRLKILEAMALGTPVVATSKGAEGLAVKDGQHLLLADTPDHFAEQVIGLLRQPERRQQLVQQARRLVESKYDWQQIGQQFVNLVENVAARKKRAIDG